MVVTVYTILILQAVMKGGDFYKFSVIVLQWLC